MATGIGDLVVNLGLNRSGYSSGLRSARSQTSGFVSGLRSIMAPVAGLLATAAAGLGAKKSIDAARTQIQAEQKLAAVLKATGGAAGLTAQQIQSYASDLQKVTNFGDETTISAAGMLATFREIKGDTFKEALGLAQDLSATFGTDMKSSVVQVGKALNDPIRGITALQRIGITFSDEQRKQIQQMQEMGNVTGAQGIILDELKNQFGGTAKAMADPLTQAGNIVGDIGELIGFVLLPPLREVMAVFTSGVGPLTDNREGFEQLGESIAGVVRSGLEPLKEGFTTAVSVITSGVETIAFVFRNAADLAELAMLDLSIAATEWIPGLEAGLQNLGAFFFALWETVQVSFGDFVDNVKNGFTEILNAGEALVKSIKAAFDALVTGKNPLEAFGETFIETLANQTGTEGFKTSDLQQVFTEARDNALEGFADPGQGLVDNLRRQRDAVADRIGQREVAAAAAAQARRTQETTEAVTSPESAARGGQTRGASALQAGTREAASAILRAQIGAANPQKKLEQQGKQQLDEAKKQTTLMQQFVDVAGAAAGVPVLGFEGGS